MVFMGTPSDIITIDQAARILGVTVNMVRKLVADCVLRTVPVAVKGRPKKHFLRGEVNAYAEIRAKKLTLVDVMMTAERAYALSRSNEKRITQLMNVMGLNDKVLETTEEAVVSLVLQATDAEMQAKEERPSVATLMHWAKTLYAVNEGYLDLVATHTVSVEPWAPFIHLAQALVDSLNTDDLRANKELEEAYSYIEAARRNLRHVAYFYLWEKRGSQKANKVFGVKDYAAPILNTLFPN
jgi:hypothetical protein